jgi:hypothetical protein
MKKTLALLIIIILAAAGAFYFTKRTIVETVSRPAVEQEKKVWQEKTRELEKKVAELQDEVKKNEPSVPQEKLSEAFGETAALSAQEKENRCQQLNQQTTKFFSYLNDKGYIKAQGTNGDAYEQYKKTIGLLETTRPLISGETQDLYTLMRNISFFCRVLGDKTIRVALAILSQESEIMEPTIRLFYDATNPWTGWNSEELVGLSSEALYDYAGFFVNTIAGHAYLARRDLKVRTLGLYYSILIVDKANENGLNKYGIDIRPAIASLLEDIKSQRGLLYRKDYLNTLTGLRKKYAGPQLIYKGP